MPGVARRKLGALPHTSVWRMVRVANVSCEISTPTLLLMMIELSIVAVPPRGPLRSPYTSTPWCPPPVIVQWRTVVKHAKIEGE